MSQCDMILQHMKDHGAITPREALNEYGCMRLGARIYDLKHSGINIVRDTVEAENKFGELTRFARYRLEERDV